MQLRLQRELFTPQNEQLLSMVHCLRVEKEKNKPTKDIFLCIVNETDRFSLHGQLNINIVEAKGTSGEKRNYDLPKRKRSWTLHELKSIDAKHKGLYTLCYIKFGETSTYLLPLKHINSDSQSTKHLQNLFYYFLLLSRI